MKNVCIVYIYILKHKNKYCFKIILKYHKFKNYLYSY